MAAPRRSTRNSATAPRPVKSAQMASLFWPVAGRAPPSMKGRLKLQPLHSEPWVYMIPNFLSEAELRHLDEIRGQHKRKFESARSYTDSADGTREVSEHRTSTFIFLRKFGDAATRKIESKAADLVGLPPDNVEPLQIVSYRDGQQFGVHHDMGPLEDDGSAPATLHQSANTEPLALSRWGPVSTRKPITSGAEERGERPCRLLSRCCGSAGAGPCAFKVDTLLSRRNPQHHL